jgi:hypothetical protein
MSAAKEDLKGGRIIANQPLSTGDNNAIAFSSVKMQNTRAANRRLLTLSNNIY